MRPALLTAALACACLPMLHAFPARAHVVAGDRVFPVTLTIDDPGVSDEMSLPALTYSRSGADGRSGPGHEVDLGFEYDKTITSNTALIFNDGYDIQQMNGTKTQAGSENIYITGKWQAYTNAAHEFVVSLGIIRELGGTGTTHTGGDRYGSTSPTGYFGKGLGDLPIGYARPLAVTGELSYTIADKELKSFTPLVTTGASASTPFDTGIAGQFNNGNNNAWSGGLTLQYSLPYLQSQVKDVGLWGIFADLIPVVEFTWSSPASSPSAQGTTWTAAPGVIYLASWGEVGLEALVPLNKAAGTNVGALGLVHFFFDDLYPNTIGKPLFE
ncbi:MAG: hypothetical protein ACRYHQ_19340 [Janthinobacterium lividum]